MPTQQSQIHAAILLPFAPSSQPLMQEECCWARQSSATPALALTALSALAKNISPAPALIHIPLNPTDLDLAPLKNASVIQLIHTWIFGDLLTPLINTLRAHTFAHIQLIANPPATLPYLAEKYPALDIITAPFNPAEPIPFDLIPPGLWPTRRRILYQYASGCHYNCPYCVWQNRLAAKTPSLIADDLAGLLARVPEARADFTGESISLLGPEITISAAWLRSLCDKIQPFRIHWNADINIRNAIKSPNILPRAAAAGLRRAILGIEFFTNPMLKKLNKGHTVKSALTVMEICRDAGIAFRFSLRSGVGETPDDLLRLRENLELIAAKNLNPQHISLGPMVEWPGVPWLDRLAPGAEITNLGTPDFPRRAVRLTDDIKTHWKTIIQTCQDKHWTK